MSTAERLDADELARCLAPADEAPSAALCQRVMAAVVREARRPPRLRFPWPRFAVGLAATLAAVLLLAWEGRHSLGG